MAQQFFFPSNGGVSVSRPLVFLRFFAAQKLTSIFVQFYYFHLHFHSAKSIIVFMSTTFFFARE